MGPSRVRRHTRAPSSGARGRAKKYARPPSTSTDAPSAQNSGKPVSVWGVVIDVVRNGIFTESRIIMDVPSLLRQLGATA